MKFEIIDHGTLVGFTPASDAAQQWWDDNVQWCPMMGDAYLVESHYAQAIIDGIQAASGSQGTEDAQAE